jgi:AcrR family transcriptional regulator
MLSVPRREDKPPGGCGDKEAPMFGKPGRPREDGFRRRWEIYSSVAPLLEKVGARGLTMRQAAAAAHMSLGGIYHYFASKRDLVLYGVSPEALQGLCEQAHQRLAQLERADPQAHLATFLDDLVWAVSVVRPALVAAIELGAGPALDTVEAAMKVTLQEFIRAVRAMRTDLGDAEAQTLDRALRHAVLGAMVDRSATPSDLRDELRSIVELRLLAAPAAPLWH